MDFGLLSLINPSDPDIIFYTCPPRGGVITPPLVKSIFHIDMHIFLHVVKFCNNYALLSGILPKFPPILMNFCIL